MVRGRYMESLNLLKEKQLDILRIVDKVCRENGIIYYLAYGTAIGAVRHQGFIPWDDDIDIIMLRDDYNKFLDKVQQQLPRNIFVQTYKSDKGYNLPFAKIRDSETTCQETGCENLDINHGVFIDLFPYDYIPEGKINRLKQSIYAELIWILLRKNEKKSGVKKIITNIISSFVSENKYEEVIEKLENKMSKYDKANCGYVANLNYGFGYASRLFSKKMFNPIEISFENEKFLIMEGYDQYLTMAYGDYMKLPPVEQRVGGHGYTIVDTNKSYIEVLNKNSKE